MRRDSTTQGKDGKNPYLACYSAELENRVLVKLSSQLL